MPIALDSFVVPLTLGQVSISENEQVQLVTSRQIITPRNSTANGSFYWKYPVANQIALNLVGPKVTVASSPSIVPQQNLISNTPIASSPPIITYQGPDSKIVQSGFSSANLTPSGSSITKNPQQNLLSNPPAIPHQRPGSLIIHSAFSPSGHIPSVSSIPTSSFIHRTDPPARYQLHSPSPAVSIPKTNGLLASQPPKNPSAPQSPADSGPPSPPASPLERTVTLRRDVLLAKYFALEFKAGVGATVGRDSADRAIIVDLRPEGSAFKSGQASAPHPSLAPPPLPCAPSSYRASSPSPRSLGRA
jgi:hypothetical protein